MAETDILNPLNWHALGFAFNPNPSYGFSRRMSNNRSMQRPRLGPWITRDIANAGHIFPLSWINTDITTAQRVVKFYHDFKNGYFTFINPDWSNRQFVGRFTAEPEVIGTANGKWTIHGAQFEEIPTARMVVYPYDFANDGHPINVVDDFFPGGVPNPLVALMQGTWVTHLNPTLGAPSATDPTAYEAFNVTPAAGDWAQTQYTGWGFQMVLRLANTLGAVHVLLDGVQILTSLDLSSGAAAATTGLAALTVAAGVSVTVTALNVPLDMHRVKLVYAGPSAAAGVSILYPALEYIY